MFKILTVNSNRRILRKAIVCNDIIAFFQEHNYKLHSICPQIFPSSLKLRKEDPTLLAPPQGYDLIKAGTYQAKSSAKLYVRPPSDEVKKLKSVNFEIGKQFL